MDVALIVPWRGGCHHRAHACEWVLRQFSERLPLDVSVGEGDDPWVKGNAVMDAVEGTRAEVLVVHDADVWSDGTEQAIEAVKAGAPWAMPHTNVHRLTEAGTQAVLRGWPWPEQPTEQKPYRGVEGGGIVVLRRETYFDVPIDPRFVGFGQEDESWAMALRVLTGEPWRGPEPLVHLWHPPQPRVTRRRGSRASWDLRLRYFRARREEASMRAIIQEARDALHVAQPTVLNRPA